MSRRIAALLPALSGGLLTLALLYPEPDPRALAAQGFSRLLASDRAAARDAEPGVPGTGSVFRVLEEAGAPRFALTLTREPGGQGVEGDPAFRRAFESVLNVVNAERAARDETPLEIASGAPRTLALVLVEGREGFWLEGTLRDATRRIELGRRGPWKPPGRAALIPPLLAILLALSLRRTIPALFAGIWIGAALLRTGAGSGPFAALGLGLWDVAVVYLLRELVDSFRIEIIGFVIALVAMVGVTSRGGGVQGLVELVLRFARSVRSTLGVAFGMGCMIFFDDYSNCLIVGNTLRPLTDRLRISREKLAYVVDSTAAPVAGLSLLSTWIAFEVSTFAAQLPSAGITEDPYLIFIESIPFRFYCLFTLGFVLLNVLTGRDFGPMLRAELRARSTGQVVRPGGAPMVSAEMTSIEASPALPHRARNALVPIGTVLVVTLEEIFRAGGGFALAAHAPGELLRLSAWTELLLEAGGAGPLFAGSTAGLAVAIYLVGSNAVRVSLAVALAVAVAGAPPLAAALGGVVSPTLATYAALGLLGGASFGLVAWALQGLGPRTRRPHLDGSEVRRAAISSTRALSFAVVILFEAWMIGRVCQDVGTADYLVALSARGVTPVSLPVILFGAACLVSFATGTSWGTMAVLLPNVVGLASAVGADHPIGSLGLVVVCIGAVLEGSIFGDHASPISDTTVLSSVSTASDHIDHVRTQAPYALCTAGAAVVAGYLPTLLFDFWSLPLALTCGLGALLGLLFLVGRRAPD